MGLVVDTNIFASASLKESSWPGEIVRWLHGFGVLLKTPATEAQITEAQITEVLRRPYFASKVSATYLDDLRTVFSKAEVVTIVERITACRDSTDDRFLELAVNGHAVMIVSGDLDLLVLHPFRGIPIIAPRAFCHAHIFET